MRSFHPPIFCFNSAVGFPAKFVLAATLIAVLSAASLSRADDLSEASPIYGKLASPMNSVFDGKSFRSAIAGIAGQVDLNVWLDRRVDPTTPIKAAASGATVYGAIEQIAGSRDCVLMPVGNVLLVGRRDWVAKLTATMLNPASTKNQASSKIIDVNWDDLTTPTAALKRVLGNKSEMAQALPHDLWPKTSWTQINQNVAVALILAQFDLQFDPSLFPQRLVTSPLPPSDSFSRRYSSTLARAVRPTITSVDADSSVRLSGQWLQAKANFNAHLSATQAIFAALKPKLPDPDKDTFTLKQMRTSAGNALQQLCRVAGRRCEIADNARQACEITVTVQGKDATLRELIELVATQAGVKATWGDGVISISL